MQTLPLLSPFLAVGLYLILKKLGLLPGARASTAPAKHPSEGALISTLEEMDTFLKSNPVLNEASERLLTSLVGETCETAPQPATPPECAKEKESPVQEPRVVYENSPALNAFLNSEMSTWGKALYDPQCDEPLPPEIEHNLQALGGPVFLQQLCQMHGLDVQPATKTAWECARAARKIIRTEMKQFEGERYFQ